MIILKRVYNIDDLVKQILDQNFSGTEEEIVVQQVVYLDKYIKEKNIVMKDHSDFKLSDGRTWNVK